MADERWTAETEDLVRSAIADPTRVLGTTDTYDTMAAWGASAVLTALADAGLLLPPSGETRDMDGYWNPDLREVQTWWSYSEMGYKAPDRVRTITTWPDGSTLVGPWRPVDTEEAKP